MTVSGESLSGSLAHSSPMNHGFRFDAVSVLPIRRRINFFGRISFPLIILIYLCFSKSVAVQMLIFVSFAGLKVRDIEMSARSVLPRFYSKDVHPREILGVFFTNLGVTRFSSQTLTSDEDKWIT